MSPDRFLSGRPEQCECGVCIYIDAMSTSKAKSNAAVVDMQLPLTRTRAVVAV